MLHVFPMNLVALLASAMPVQATIGQGGGENVCAHHTPQRQRCKGKPVRFSWENHETILCQPATSNLQINKIPWKKHENKSSLLWWWFITALIKYFWGECISSILFFQVLPLGLQRKASVSHRKGLDFKGRIMSIGAAASPQKEQNKANPTIPCHTAPLQSLAVLKRASFSSVCTESCDPKSTLYHEKYL